MNAFARCNALPAFFVSPAEKVDTAFRRSFLLGILLWLLLGLCFVLVRGVRWDESYEHAQILAGLVQYPAGHPLPAYLQTAFSLQTWISTLLLRMGMGAAWVCGFRNLIFLWAFILPIFCLTTLISRRALWGHLATLLMLYGILLEFDGSYPTFVWPELYSNGHIGGGFSVLVLALFAARRFRWAFLGSALMAALHLGQFPMALGLCLAATFFLTQQDRAQELKSVLIFIFLIAGLLAAWLYFKADPVIDGLMPEGYHAQGNVDALWRNYTTHFDPHRSFPPGNGHILVAGSLLLTVLAAWRYRERREGPIFAWLGLYCVGVAVAVWGVMSIHYFLGEGIPFLLIFWMPYRLINHLPPILLASLIGILSMEHREKKFSWPALFCLVALAWTVAHPYLSGFFPERFYSRYIAQGDGLTFALFGAAFCCLSQGARKKDRPLIFFALFLLATVLLFPYHRFGAAAMLGGAVLITLGAPLRITKPVPSRAFFAMGYALSLIALAFLLHHQWQHRLWLPRSESTLKITDYLETAQAADALMVTEPYSYMVQAQTGHPVLAEAATPSLISYAPHLAPLINQIYFELYGMRFIPQCHTCDHPSHQWPALWEKRSTKEWRRLSQRYAFRYVLTPPDLSLHLPLALDLPEARLYEVATGE